MRYYDGMHKRIARVEERTASGRAVGLVLDFLAAIEDESRHTARGNGIVGIDVSDIQQKAEAQGYGAEALPFLFDD